MTTSFKIISKFSTSLLLAVLLLSFTTSKTEVNWNTDFEQSMQMAKNESKFILMNFSGSDWCANCIRLDKTLFQSEEFLNLSQENLVLLKVDFPTKKKNRLSDNQTSHNEKLADKYNKKGAFPTVLLLDTNGEVVGKLNQPQNTVEAYIADLKKIMNR